MNARAWTLLGALLALTACERPDALDRPLDARGPFALGHHVAYVVASPPRVALLQPAARTVHFVDLDARPRQVFAEPAGRGLLVLAEDDDAWWIPADASGVGRPRRFALDGQYGAAAFGPDARRVVLYHLPGARRGVISNPNQVALLDLAAGTRVERSLRSFGSQPNAVVVGPARALAGAERQLAWVMAERYLAVVDLAAPEAREVVVHLTLAEDPRPVTPTQVTFGEVEGAATYYVRADGSDDVFALTFPDAAPADTVPVPYLNQLPAGPAPADVVALDVADGPRVFAAGAGVLSVIDPITGRQVPVSVGHPATRLLPFRAPRADGEGEGWSALVWAPGGAAVVFADLDLLEQRRGRAMTPLVLPTPLTELSPLPGRRAAVGRDGSSRVVLLDFDARTATPLEAGGVLGVLRVDPGGDRVYVTVQNVAEFDRYDLASIDVDTATASSARLPDTPRALLLVPGAGRLVVDHGTIWGRVSLAPLTDLKDDRVLHHEGVLLTGAFDR